MSMNSIEDQTRQDLLLHERALWTALTGDNPGPALMKMCDPNVNLIFPQMPILTVSGHPPIQDVLKPHFHHFDNYALEDIRIAVIDRTAGVVVCKVAAAHGNQAHNISASTTWGREVGGEWRVVCHQETPL